MPRYTAQVTELVAVEKIYVVEADDIEEALEKAECGDTLSERVLRETGVHDRLVDESWIAELVEPTGPTAWVSIIPQRWHRDRAIEVDAEGDTTWPVHRSEVTPAMAAEFPDLDELRFSHHAPKWVREWDGPFYIAPVDDDEWATLFEPEETEE